MIAAVHLSRFLLPPASRSAALPPSHRRRFFRPAASGAGAAELLESASVLAAIILVHESGHFLAATLQGIHVSQFSIGFGPALARFRLAPAAVTAAAPSSSSRVKSKPLAKKSVAAAPAGVEFSLRAFPLGGYVGFPDDDPDAGFAPDDPDLLRNRPVLDRLIVVSAGVVANIVFAYTVIFAQTVSVGLPVQIALPGVLVPEVRPNSAAARAGIVAGDVILNVRDAPSLSVPDLVDVIKARPQGKVLFSIARGASERLEVTVVPDIGPDGSGRIGVQLSPNFRVTKVRAGNLAEATVLASKEFWALTSSVFDGLRQTFTNFSQSAEKVSGPVAIIAVGAEVARSSIDGLFQFAAVINLNLAAINLLPLPALDGGSLALLLIEAARGGQKIPREIEQRIMSSGILVVVMFGLFLIVRDTLNLDFIREIL